MAESTGTRKEQRASARAERQQADAARERQRRRLLWILGGLGALAVAIVLAIVLASGSDSDKPALKKGEQLPGQFEANARFKDIPQDGVTLGRPDAPVTFVEFADLQCPFCRDFSQSTMPELVARYVSTGKMKMVFRNVSFISDDSLRAAQMAAAAGEQDKLWQFVEIFYANQGPEKSGYVTDEFLRKIGRAVKGLDVEKAMTARGSASVQKQLTEAQEAAAANAVSGTPTFLVGPTGGTLKQVELSPGFPAGDFTGPIDRALQARS